MPPARRLAARTPNRTAGLASRLHRKVESEAATGSGRRWLAGLLLVLAGVWSPPVAGAEPEDYLEQRWYRIEVAVFVQEAPAGAARPRELAALRYPRPTALLTAGDSPANRLGLPLATPLADDQPPPLVISNLPPPVWFAGPCAKASWRPRPGGPRVDPCLPGPGVDLEAKFPDPPFALWPDYPQPAAAATAVADATPPAAEEDPAAIAAALREDFAAYEAELRRTSYVFRYQAPNIAQHVTRLRRQRQVLLVGSWHQPLPPRTAAPEAVILLAGEADAQRRFALEGVFDATIGRLIHLSAQLQWHQPDGAIAVLAERRPMRSGELHYLDHPAFGLVARVEAVALPADLQRRVAELDAPR